MAKIVLYGATGTIGQRILTEAVSRGHQVTAVVRDPAKAAVVPDGVTVVTGNVLDPKSVTSLAEDKDVVISAVGGKDAPSTVAVIEPAARSLVEGLRGIGDDAPRLITVGGAGSLETAPGVRVWDAEGLPDSLLQIMHAHGDAVEYLKTVTDVRWTNLSPAAQIAPGERTGSYRTGTDALVIADDGTSHISAEDYAVALIDEVEKPVHIGERFTVGV